MKVAKPLSAVVLLSGNGTTFENLHKLSRGGALALDIKGVLSSRPNAYGLKRARIAGVATNTVSRKDYTDAWSFSREVFRMLSAIKPELVILAGFMSLLKLPERYLGRVINIHPALLPKFGGKGMYGQHVHQAVLDSGDKKTGCSVHFVDNEYDHGPIILQKKVAVEEGDTAQSLMERVQLVEREAFPEAINMIADGRVKYEDGKAEFPD